MLLKDTLLIVGTLVFVALAVVVARLRRSRHLIIETGEAVEIPGDGCGANPSEEADMSGLLLSTLRRDLSLAAEHVHSIRWLLEIAMQHQQPIPRACERVRIARVDDEPGVADDFRRVAYVGDDARQPARHALDHDVGEALGD